VAVASCGYPRLPAIDDGGVGGSDGPGAPDAPVNTRKPSGAVLWLEMESDGYVDSAAGHAASCTKCPTLTAGKFGSGYLFDGTSVLTISAATDVVHGAGFTVAAWVKLARFVDATNPGLIAGKQTAPNQGAEAMLLQHSMHMGYYSTPGSYATGGATIAIGEWHHFAFVWDGATKRGYADGVLDATQANASIDPDAAAPFDIGGDPGAPQLNFAGVLDDVVFFPRVLSEAEIAQLMAGPTP
jgi:concanavalin A-like lectin/glucanase superfamily protein